MKSHVNFDLIWRCVIGSMPWGRTNVRRIFLMSAVAMMTSSLLAPSQLLASSCETSDTSSAKQPTNQIQIDIANQKLQQLSGSPDVVFVGDSLVQFWPSELTNYAASSNKVFNFGVGLDRTQHVLWRLEAAQLQVIHPRKVYVLVGTNNLSAGDTACAIASGIEAVLRRVNEIWPHAARIVIPIPPRGNDFLFRNADRIETNRIVKDNGDRSKQWASTNIDAVISCNFTDPCGNYLPDKVHFSEAGYKSLSDLIRSSSKHKATSR
ncbi:GDSL-type esterase/lipase family protein [Methylobacterium sp. D48H]